MEEPYRIMNIVLGVSFVILSYNRKAELANTLRALQDLDLVNSEIIVVDNASSDGSGEMVLRLFPQVRLIQRTVNNGIAGWNDGFRSAQMPFVFVLDDDSHPLPGAVQLALERMASDSSCAIVSCTVCDDSGKDTLTARFSPGYEFSFVGCGAVLRKDVIDALGGYDNNIFLYAHEMEYALRVLNAGYRIYHEPRAKVVHVESISNRHVKNRVSRRAVYQANRSIFYLMISRFSFIDVVARLVRMTIGRLIFATCHGVGITAARGIIEGIILGLRSRKGTVKPSREVALSYRNIKHEGGLFGPVGLAFSSPLYNRYGRTRSKWTVRKLLNHMKGTSYDDQMP
jgi:GT2 family glycosyltransferase